MNEDSALIVGDLCVAAYLPLQHVWKIGLIIDITENGTYHVDIGGNSNHNTSDRLFLKIHEIRTPPKGAAIGDIFKGDIFKKQNMNKFTMVVIPAQRVWTDGEYEAGARHP